MRRTSTFRRHKLARPRGLAARTPPRFQDRPARSLLRRLVRPTRHRGHHLFLCLVQVPTWAGTPKLPLRRRWRRTSRRGFTSPLTIIHLKSLRSPPFSMAVHSTGRRASGMRLTPSTDSPSGSRTPRSAATPSFTSAKTMITSLDSRSRTSIQWPSTSNGQTRLL